MSETTAPFIFKYPLLNRGLHFDFLRLRCGTEAAFHEVVWDMHPQAEDRPRTFVAMSEWDAVVILPATELYPKTLNDFYDNWAIDSKIAGTAGYFGYLWAHEINLKLDDKLNRFQRDGLGMIVSLRFADWVRRQFGLGAEILFCEYLHERILRLHREEATEETTFSAIVAHTLGWNDIVCVLNATTETQRLLRIQSEIRLLTLRDIFPSDCDIGPYLKYAETPLFAASYTHVVGGYEALIRGKSAMGNLSDQVVAATLLVRVPPALEWPVRKEIEALSGINAADMPTEMGHYTFSVNITPLIKDGYGGRTAMQLLSEVRGFIGKQGHDEPSNELFNSYAETTTIFRFRDTSDRSRELRVAPPDDETKQAIEAVRKLMENLPEQLRGRRGSPMTAHRFGTVLTALLDHLSDPIRSSVVRHIKRFLVETANITDLDRQDMEDLCQIAEYAMTQATDGLAQFQHDANSLGLTGRGGYSRLITAIENYVDDILVSFKIPEKDVLITFGLRQGHIGSMARFHIDIPFNVLFVPSRWYILLHEVGHIAWLRKFGWMPESLAMFSELERETVFEGDDDERNEYIRAEFIRTREIIRELFPNLLVYMITCGSDIEAFDRLSLRHILSHSRPGHGTRELLIAVVLNCVLTVAGEARAKGRDWMSMFLVERSPQDIEKAMQISVGSVSRALDLPVGSPGSAHLKNPTKNNYVPAGFALSEHVQNTVKNKQALLISPPFAKSAQEAVESVFRALRNLAKLFARTDHLEHALFADVEEAVDALIKEQKDVESWSQDEGFAQWLMKGEVLAVSPGAHVWAKLLHDNRDKIKRSVNPAAFMTSQIAALLSIWHRAEVSAGGHDTAAKEILKNCLRPLKLVERKSFGSNISDRE
jgi:hypothetical protein